MPAFVPIPYPRRTHEHSRTLPVACSVDQHFAPKCKCVRAGGGGEKVARSRSHGADSERWMLRSGQVLWLGG